MKVAVSYLDNDEEQSHKERITGKEVELFGALKQYFPTCSCNFGHDSAAEYPLNFMAKKVENQTIWNVNPANNVSPIKTFLSSTFQGEAVQHHLQ